MHSTKLLIRPCTSIINSFIQTRSYYDTANKTDGWVKNKGLLNPTADFRSDTVTKPCSEMRRAMVNAVVADEIYDGDPTVQQLEEYTAKLCNKESAMFCVSTTMANQIAIACTSNRLTKVMCDSRSHVFTCETGAAAMISQAQLMPIAPTQHLTVSDIESAYTEPDIHFPDPKMVVLENTLYGSLLPLQNIIDIQQFCATKDLHLHLDGARVWNAAIVESENLGVSLEEAMQKITHPFDSVTLCLSKGIGAPVGGVLLGSKQLIHKAKHYRKALGGGWRQAGVLAAACMYGIEHNWPKMREDHANAQLLADKLADLGFAISMPVETNHVWADSTKLNVTFDELSAFLRKQNFNINAGSSFTNRFVTHIQTSKQNILDLVKAINRLLQNK